MRRDGGPIPHRSCFLRTLLGHASAWQNQCAVAPTSCDKWRAVVAAALLDAGRIVELAVLRNFKFTALGKAGRADARGSVFRPLRQSFRENR